MPRFLTPEWVTGFNAALEGVALPAPGPEAGLAAADGRFTVAQEVRGTPDGDVRLLLRTESGALALEVGPLGSGGDADVTIALGYDDAAALATGALSRAEALNAGRIRVRGDLSVLAAGQELLVAAREHTRALDADTTY
ncbi:MAG TPA: SCP2 sterol-binding domain-containing protein [Acidimicrobiales bacterium]